MSQIHVSLTMIGKWKVPKNCQQNRLKYLFLPERVTSEIKNNDVNVEHGNVNFSFPHESL